MTEETRCIYCKEVMVHHPAKVFMKMFQHDRASCEFYMLRLTCKNKCTLGSVMNEEALFVGNTYRKIFKQYREKFR